MDRTTVLGFALGGLLAGPAAASPPVTAEALRAHAPGIWSLAPADGWRRWVVIHDLGSREVLHVEILAAEPAAPAWRVKHLADHMAVTLEALLRSVRAPLERGAVYPESFDEALRRWRSAQAAEAAPVCRTTIDRCLAGEW
jgi:hypothetical protein